MVSKVHQHKSRNRYFKTFMSIEKSKIKHYCDTCQNDTNHFVISSKTVTSDDPEYRLETKYMIVECYGCESVSFRREIHDYETSYPDEYDNWTYDKSINIYLARARLQPCVQHPSGCARRFPVRACLRGKTKRVKPEG